VTFRNFRTLALLLALASAGAGLPRSARAAPDASAAGGASKPDAKKDAADLDALLDELGLAGIGFDQRQLLLHWAQGEFCYCGCPHTVGSCLLHHPACKHSKRMVRLAAGVLQVDPKAKPEFVQGFVTQYYASFDKRVKIDVAAYGPPLGEEKAPVTLVVFSDFTCPFCRASRPVLEEFVAKHPGRVKLVFKPYPILSHPGAFETAMAGEWARQQGAFWKMHDALFQSEQHDLDALADAAEAAGLDPAELRDAVMSSKTEARVRASQTEASHIGVHGTPTLFMNGRRLDLPELNASWLEFTLEDEEELLANGGRWAKD
jgi:protein-disulfide isomerase